MTHGEQWYLNKDRFYHNSKKFESCDAIDRGLPKRMSKSDALDYYNKKLIKYWTSTSLKIKHKEPPMPPATQKTKIQDRFESIKDNDVLNITKAQLIALVERVRQEAIQAHEKNNQFNADEIFHALKVS